MRVRTILATAARRNARSALAAVTALVAFGAAGTAIAVTSSNGDPGLQTARATGSVDPSTAAQLGLFKRARTSSDVLPQDFQNALEHGMPQAGADPAESRRTTASDGQVAYLVPANGGVCAINTNELFCAPSATLAGANAVDLCSPTLPKGQVEVEWLLPDAAQNPIVRMSDGSSSPVDPGYNVYIKRFPLSGALPRTIEWDLAGQHESVSAGLPADARTENCLHPSDLPPASQLPTGPTGTVGP